MFIFFIFFFLFSPQYQEKWTTWWKIFD